MRWAHRAHILLGTFFAEMQISIRLTKKMLNKNDESENVLLHLVQTTIESYIPKIDAWNYKGIQNKDHCPNENTQKRIKTYQHARAFIYDRHLHCVATERFKILTLMHCAQARTENLAHKKKCKSKCTITIRNLLVYSDNRESIAGKQTHQISTAKKKNTRRIEKRKRKHSHHPYG